MNGLSLLSPKGQILRMLFYSWHCFEPPLCGGLGTHWREACRAARSGHPPGNLKVISKLCYKGGRRLTLSIQRWRRRASLSAMRRKAESLCVYMYPHCICVLFFAALNLLLLREAIGGCTPIVRCSLGIHHNQYLHNISASGRAPTIYIHTRHSRRPFYRPCASCHSLRCSCTPSLSSLTLQANAQPQDKLTSCSRIHIHLCCRLY